MSKKILILVVVALLMGSVFGGMPVMAQESAEDVVEIVIPKKFLVINDFTASSFCANYTEEDGFVACEEMEDFDVSLTLTQAYQTQLIDDCVNYILAIQEELDWLEELTINDDLTGFNLYFDVDELTEEEYHLFYSYFNSAFYYLNVFQGLGNDNVEFSINLYDMESQQYLIAHTATLEDIIPEIVYVEILFTDEDFERIGKNSEDLKEELSLESGFFSSEYDAQGNWEIVITDELQQKLMYRTNTLFFAYVFHTESEDQTLGVFGSDESGYFFSIEDEDIPMKPNSLEFGYVDEKMYDYVFYVDKALFNSDEEQAMIKFVESLMPDYWLYAKQPKEERYVSIYFSDFEKQETFKIFYIPEDAFGYEGELAEIKMISDNFESFEEFAKESIENGFIYAYINEAGEYISVGTQEKVDRLVEKLHKNLNALLNLTDENVKVVENEDFTEFRVSIPADSLTDEMEAMLTENINNVVYVIHTMVSITDKDTFTIEFVDANSGEVLKTIEETLIFE